MVRDVTWLPTRHYQDQYAGDNIMIYHGDVMGNDDTDVGGDGDYAVITTIMLSSNSTLFSVM